MTDKIWSIKRRIKLLKPKILKQRINNWNKSKKIKKGQKILKQTKMLNKI